MQACDLLPLVPEYCSEVLDAMFFATVSGWETLAHLPADKIEAKPSLNFNLHFTGDVSGHFVVSLESSTAGNLAANFLGEDPTALSPQEVDEVVGELANMLCGSVMSQVEGEHKFVLSHPGPVGDQSSLSTDDALICVLETDAGAITVCIALEGEPCPL